METYIVICHDADTVDYTLATRRVFHEFRDALAYAGTVHPSLCPLVVSGRFDTLRFEAKSNPFCTLEPLDLRGFMVPKAKGK